MMRAKEFFTLAELAAAALPELPATARGLAKRADAEGWKANPKACRKASGREGGGGFEYHISLLPKAAQLKLTLLHSAPANTDRDFQAERRQEIWARYEALPLEHKAVAQARLLVLNDVAHLKAAGIRQRNAIAAVIAKAGISESTYYSYCAMVEGLDRQDWLAALAPSYATDRARAECHEEAWDVLKSDFLRPEKPSFSACYRRVVAVAAKKGWSPIPSERALRRRLDAEVPEAVQKLARDGRERTKALYPAQRRTRSHLHAMQAVNMDGHRVDVFVRMPDNTITRLYLIALQDLYSGKFVAWRLSESENWISVRLVIGDMVERFGIPDMITLDNGRAFASKWISGGARTRFRFKVREEDPQGLLVALGIHLQWTKPFSGQSKPIERAFRDLTDDISRHPVCAGAYTGNKPDAKPENYASRAVPFDVFVAHVDQQMAEHNARVGRKAGNCKGRSFDQTFEASIAEPSTIVRWPSAAQASLWLLASEAFKARKGNGEIHLHGNRFWHPALTAYAGKKVIIRFDPDHLKKPLKVYDLNNALICDAQCIEDTGYHDAAAARQHESQRNAYRKALAQQKAAHAKMTAQQLADLYSEGEKKPAPKPERKRPAVTRLLTGNLAVQPAASMSDEEFEDSFSKAMRQAGGASILEFPKGNAAEK
ncbi:Mu DNA-binding protein [Rhizobium subbaraonis]|uniref:Mu DNA-binding protein n=1 Tax=Rhizobium subbaraonis TaxID=908946 RepID=A0A285UIL7_9HYPH|nr:transposase domain-containing protein [Rhizobium subbaraonis]SOC41623.1 Mu DNA-binding protein [Rhizobium subbaraonis]